MITPELVIEYHYADGDVGTYEAGKEAQALWRAFAAAHLMGPGHDPSHIVIRPKRKGE